jgi:hypothetical protein
MHIAEIHARGFRRFADLTVRIPSQPRLVVLAGPNGNGKSSLFDGLRLWQSWRDGRGVSGTPDYYTRPEGAFGAEQVVVSFHEPDPSQGAGQDAVRKAIYVRSAYRNDPEFASVSITRPGRILDAPVTARMIDNDVRVAENYARMAGQTFVDLYGGEHDHLTAGELREKYIAGLRDALQRIFPDLLFSGPGDPLVSGTFMFRKGDVANFPYKNLSGGEKAVFDLLLDLVVKLVAYDDSVICIDEPEAHLNTRVQGDVLSELMALMNDRSQLWIASHSIGMMRRAYELAGDAPEAVVFLDLEDKDFDGPVTLEPVPVDRRFFRRVLNVALGDVASLVAPGRVVICEGKPAGGAPNPSRAEFDARCYRRIFGDSMPATDFISVGNSREVAGDALGVGSAIAALLPGTTVVRVVDRDLRSAHEIADLQAQGVRVLGRRHIESFLLDDEVLRALCVSEGRDAQIDSVLGIKDAAVQASIDRGNDADDLKSAAGDVYVGVRRVLSLTQPGNSSKAFLSDVLAPLIRPGMATYQALEADLFG